LVCWLSERFDGQECPVRIDRKTGLAAKNAKDREVGANRRIDTPLHRMNFYRRSSDFSLCRATFCLSRIHFSLCGASFFLRSGNFGLLGIIFYQRRCNFSLSRWNF